jgi:hypothetical protein
VGLVIEGKQKKIITIPTHLNPNKQKINYGIPQGSILGPILFNIYISDIAKSVNAKLIHYADDTVLCFSHKDVNELVKIMNKLLKDIIQWMEENRLLLNAKKTVAMIFGNKNDLQNHYVVINEERIYFSSTAKYLGIIIDDKLKWKAHIEYVLPYLHKGIAMLSLVKYQLPTKVKLMLYYSYFVSRITYCIEIWGNCNETDKQNNYTSKTCYQSNIQNTIHWSLYKSNNC